MTEGAPGEFVRSVARALDVLRSFSADAPGQTLSEVAERTGLTRATARRLLLTFEHLGYVRSNGRSFELTPLVLDLGYAYLASLNIQDIAQPFLEQFSEEVQESSSVSVLDGTDVVYVARVPTKRIMTVSIGLGTRFPAFQTSMGRVLLADLEPDELADVLDRSALTARTDKSITDRVVLTEKMAEVRLLGYAVVDQELEEGIRSAAAPLRDGSGRAVAAMNVSTHAARTSMAELRERFVPRLLETSRRVSEALAKR